MQVCATVCSAIGDRNRLMPGSRPGSGQEQHAHGCSRGKASFARVQDEEAPAAVPPAEAEPPAELVNADAERALLRVKHKLEGMDGGARPLRCVRMPCMLW